MSYSIPPTPQEVKTTVAAVRADTGNPITWPFAQPQWPWSLSMLLLWWFPLPIPLLQFLTIGWSLDVVRRKNEPEAPLLPEARDIGKFMGGGAIVFCMYFVYFIIPVFVIGWITASGARYVVGDTIQWIWQHFHDAHFKENLGWYLWGQFLTLLLRAEGPAIYLLFASPLFMIARIRFAITRAPISFILIWRNLRVCFKHPGNILATLLLVSLTKFLIGILAVLLALTGLGVIGAVLLGAAQIWIVAYLLGSLAARVPSSEWQI